MPATVPSTPSRTHISDSPLVSAVRNPAVIASLLLVLAIALTYANSLTGAFVYDDKPSITYNASIRHLWSREVLNPPGGGATVSGRPVLNVTFAIDYALHGLDARGYHVTNILIHTLAALTLLGVLRRVLLLMHNAGMAPQSTLARRLTCVAAGVATLWAVHPLGTEAVTYIVQRAESLMALFYLLTLYGFLRSVDAPRPWAWRIVAWAACLLGMATKENMVSAPIIVLLLDRAFVSGDGTAALRGRWRFYAALASTWLLLGFLVLSTGGNRGGSAGFDVGVSWGQYAMTQFPALARYAALSVWPNPLVFDYGAFLIDDVRLILGPLLFVSVVIVGATYALWRLPRIGAVAAAAFAVLAPTSLVPGTTQMIVEHRMYLPLAAVLAALIPVLLRLRPRTAVVVTASAVVGLGLTTAARNRAYRSELALWNDTVAKSPNNAVAHGSLGAVYADLGQRKEALAEDLIALKLNPNYAPALANYGLQLTELGHPDQALPYVARAVEVEPHSPQAQLNLGVTLELLHRSKEALPHFAEGLRLSPVMPAALNDYGDAISRAGKFDEGIMCLQRALELEPNYVEARYNYAAALVRRGRLQDGLAEFETGARLHPNDSAAHLTWANFLFRQGHRPEALRAYETALRLAPDSAEAHYSYGTSLAGLDRYEEALTQFREAIRLRPDYAEAHNNLGNTLLATNRATEAVPEYEQALRLRPGDASTHNNLGLAYARTGRVREAVPHFEAAVRLAPDFADARSNLTHAKAQLLIEGDPAAP